MKHPKTCDGCAAFWQSQWRFHCELGYEIATRKAGTITDKTGTADIIRAFPKCGACPKPRTIRELFNAPKAQVSIPQPGRHSDLFNSPKATPEVNVK